MIYTTTVSNEKPIESLKDRLERKMSKINLQDIYHLLGHECGAPCEFDGSGFTRLYMDAWCRANCSFQKRNHYVYCWKLYFKKLKEMEDRMPESEKKLGTRISDWAVELIEPTLGYDDDEGELEYEYGTANY